MKWLVRASLIVLPILAACGDDEEPISNAPTTSSTRLRSAAPSTPAFADATVTSPATATPGPTFSAAPELFDGFREFSSLFIEALASGDTSVVIDRADRVSVTCEGIEQAGPCSGVAAGEVRSGIPGSAWRSDAGGIFSDEDYAMNLSRYREASRPAPSLALPRCAPPASSAGREKSYVLVLGPVGRARTTDVVAAPEIVARA